MNLVEDRGCSLGKCYLFFSVFLFFVWSVTAGYECRRIGYRMGMGDENGRGWRWEWN